MLCISLNSFTKLWTPSPIGCLSQCKFLPCSLPARPLSRPILICRAHFTSCWQSGSAGMNCIPFQIKWHAISSVHTYRLWVKLHRQFHCKIRRQKLWAWLLSCIPWKIHIWFFCLSAFGLRMMDMSVVLLPSLSHITLQLLLRTLSRYSLKSSSEKNSLTLPYHRLKNYHHQTLLGDYKNCLYPLEDESLMNVISNTYYTMQKAVEFRERTSQYIHDV